MYSADTRNQVAVRIVERIRTYCTLIYLVGLVHISTIRRVEEDGIIDAIVGR